MSNIQKYKAPLIQCSSDDQVVTESRESFRSFIGVFEKCGGSVNEVTTQIIKENIEQESITVSEIERGVRQCYKKEQFFNWPNILKYINAKKQTRPKQLIV
jgi:hypothetical protein